MRIKTERWCDRLRRIEKWYRWFAWHPVCFDGGWAWLSTIERRYEYQVIYAYWEYRFAERIAEELK